MATNEKQKGPGTARGRLTIGKLHKLHTQATNLALDAIAHGDNRTARRLQAYVMSLSEELRDLNAKAIKANAKRYREISVSFGIAKKAAEEALRDVSKTADFVVNLADLVSKIAKVAAFV